MLDLDITLEDKFTREEGQIYLSGCQALVRLSLEQQRFDARNGLDTAGFVSGYRGSPLGMLDFELWRARKHLEAQGIVFQPGLNEDLAMTAVWGSQQTHFFPGARHDGVFGMWYGKAPGVDRCGDVLQARQLSPGRHPMAASSPCSLGTIMRLSRPRRRRKVRIRLPRRHDPRRLRSGRTSRSSWTSASFAFAMSRYLWRNWAGFKLCATNIDTSGHD